MRHPGSGELRDAREGEIIIFLSHLHRPADTAYRASHAIFVLEGAATASELVDEVSNVIDSRLIPLAAFSEKHELVTADAVPGVDPGALIKRLFEKPSVA